MTKFEYRFVAVDTAAVPPEDEANKLGAEGFELVQMTSPRPGRAFMAFKKQVTE